MPAYSPCFWDNLSIEFGQKTNNKTRNCTVGSWGDHHDDYHRDSREESGGTTARTCADSRLLDNDKIKEIKSKLAGIIFDDRIAHAVRIAFHDCVGEGN